MDQGKDIQKLCCTHSVAHTPMVFSVSIIIVKCELGVCVMILEDFSFDGNRMDTNGHL